MFSAIFAAASRWLKRPASLALFACGFLCVAWPSFIHAYVLERSQWPDDQTILMDLQLGSPSKPLIDGSTSWNQVAESALNLWNLYLGDGVQFTFTEGQITPAQEDGKNSVFFDTTIYGEDFGSDTLGVTLIAYKHGTNVTTETDVIFNAAKSFDSYRGSLRTNNAGGWVYDLRRVAIHEFGHVLGLDHVAQGSDSIMAPVISDIDIMQADDINGVQSIYGLPTPAQPIILSPLSVVAQSGRFFVYQIFATGHPASFQASGLPPGISVNPTMGLVSGTTNAPGVYNVVLSAANSVGNASVTLTLTVIAPPVITNDLEVSATLDQPFSYQITATNQVTSYAAIGLPDSLNINPTTGLISGFPTVPGTFPITVSATNDAGTGTAKIVLKISLTDDSLVFLHRFLSSEGSVVWDSLIQGNDGNFYGIITFGGPYGAGGRIYRATPDGTLTILHDFVYSNTYDPITGIIVAPDGFYPKARVIQASDGNLYGTTSDGGIYGAGTIYRLTSDGVLTTIHSFSPAEGRASTAPLLQGADGSFYGVTRAIDPGNGVTIFKLTSEGEFSIVHSFNAVNVELSALIQGNDGALYGTTSGNFDPDTVFRCMPDGQFGTLYQFQSADGRTPGALLQANDGNFYGTTYSGGANDDGTIFRLTPGGVLTVLHSFTPVEGASASRLIQASDGNLYGVASGGGQSTGAPFGIFGRDGYGTIFATTLAGQFATLYVFDGTGGFNPVGGLLQASDGYLYGVTAYCKMSDVGTIFRKGLVPLPTESTPPTLTVTSSAASIRVGYGEVALLDLTLTNPPDTKLIVHYTMGGSAVNGTDYALLKGTTKFKAGQTHRTITVRPQSPMNGETRTVKFTLLPGDGYTVGTTKGIKIKIVGFK